VTSQLGPVLIAAAALAFIVYRMRRRGRFGPGAASGAGHRHGVTGRLSKQGSDRPPRLGVVGLVARREIRQRIRGRAFRIATIVLLLGVAAAVVIPVATRGGSSTKQVGLVGTDTPALRQAVITAVRSSDTRVHIVAEPDAGSAGRALRSGRLDVAVIDARRIVVEKASSRDDPGLRALSALLGLANAMQAAGLSPAQAATVAHAAPVPIASLEPARSNGTGRSTATVSMIIMFVLLTQYLSWTLIGVMEEKTSRVVEVLLATVRPMQLLSGKLLGIAAVVFAQAAALAVFTLALASAVGSDLLHGTAPLVLLSALAWLLLGYAFYCWLYAAAGATVERQDQVQSLALPLSLPLIAGYILGITAASSGNAAIWFRVLAYLPPTAPFAMTTLVGLGVATWWQFLISAAISAASTVAVARLAATAYGRAILRTGRRVPLHDLFARTREPRRRHISAR
jgi:ABC-2 type transport system permease protein